MKTRLLCTSRIAQRLAWVIIGVYSLAVPGRAAVPGAGSALAPEPATFPKAGASLLRSCYPAERTLRRDDRRGALECLRTAAPTDLGRIGLVAVRRLEYSNAL
jgi:hypothetical protein